MRTRRAAAPRCLPLLLLVALSWLGLAPRPAAAELRSIETQHLRLIYQSPTLDFIAPYTARCFENSLRFHSKLWDYTPSEKVNVILEDLADYGNAGVWVNPRNSMVVDIAPLNFVYETGPANERINHTMNHEVVHVLALDKPSGRDRFFRTLFRGKVREANEHPETMLYGYLTTPRRAAPRWYHEGIAVFMETWMAGGLGRAQGPYDEMVFRSKVKDGSTIYDPLGLEAEGTKVDFQAGVNSYLYGTRFLSYLAYEYEPEKLIQWVGRGSGSKAYYASQFHKVYGLPLGTAWKSWIDWEKGEQKAQLDSIDLHPITPYRDLSPRALGSISRAYYDPDTKEVYAAVLYPGVVAHLAAIPTDGKPLRRICEVKGPALYFVTSLAYDPTDKLLYYTADNSKWRDLCVADPKTGKSRVLIRDARLGDMVLNPADRTMWAVRHFNGISTLVRLQPPYTNWNRVYSWPYGRDIYDIDISPDGTKLAASCTEINGSQTLKIFRTEALLASDTTSTTLYDFGSAVPAGFVFSKDGRYLVGSSYYTGVSNIFRWNFAADSMEVVTNSETGIFRPLPIDGDSLIAFRYTGEGFVPTMIDPKPLADVSAISFLGTQLAEKYPVLTTWKAGSPATVNLDSLTTYSGPYRSVSLIRPSSLYPIVEGYKDYTSVGMRLELSDPIQTNTIGLSASYSPSEGLPANERWHVLAGLRRYNVQVSYQHNLANFYDLVGPTKTGFKGEGLVGTYTRSLMYDAPKSLNFDASAAGYTDLERLPDAQNIDVSPGFRSLVTTDLGLRYEYTRASLGSVDREKGYKWSLGMPWNLVRYDRPEGSVWQGFPQGLATLDIGTPMLLKHSSIWLRTAAGFAPGDREEPFANFYFGGFGNNYIDRKEPKRYREVQSFPGFELNEIGGTNFGKALVDWNLAPLRFRRLGTSALYAPWLRTSIFAGGLTTNMDLPSLRRTVFDLGIQSDLQIQLLTQYKLMLSGGYARGFEEGQRTSDEWMVSLKVL
jgi:hypothetical protein